MRSMGEDLAILMAGSEQAKILRELEPRGEPLATVAITKLYEYAAGWPAGGSGAGGATNITAEFTDLCPDCGGDGCAHDPEDEGMKYRLACQRCLGDGKITVALTVPQHPDRTGEQVANSEDKAPRFPAPSVLEAHIDAAAHHLRLAADIAAHAVVPVNAAPDKARDDSDDWCKSCARVTDHRGRPRAEPSQVSNGSVRRTPEGTANGQAGSPLCGWCYGFVLGEKAWPPKGLIVRRSDGFKISVEDVEKAMGRKSLRRAG